MKQLMEFAKSILTILGVTWLLGRLTLSAQQEPTKKSTDKDGTVALKWSQEELQIAEAVAQEFSAYRTTKEECQRALRAQEIQTCTILNEIKNLERLEWERLFSQTPFYLIKFERLVNIHWGPRQLTRVVAWQNKQPYKAKDFAQLLQTNNIVIKEENQLEIAQAFALLSIPKFIERDVVFTDWREVEIKQSIPYNRLLQAFTKEQDIEFKWWFLFEENKINIERLQNRYTSPPSMDLWPQIRPISPRMTYHIYFRNRRR